MLEAASQIDSWDLLGQLSYTEEWPLEFDRLARLEDYAQGGYMTDEQFAKHRRLRKLVAKNRPILERIMQTN